MKGECFYFLNTPFINKCLAFWVTVTSKVITIMEWTVWCVFDQDSFQQNDVGFIYKAGVNQLSGWSEILLLMFKIKAI